MNPARNESLLLRIYHARQKRFPSILWQGDGARREIALTFDDGPHPRDTLRVLDVLEKHGVPATFFLIGKHVEKHPHLVKQIHRSGHQLGIHCYRHLPFPLEYPSTLHMQLDRTQNVIADACGIIPETIRDVRPPYGAFTARTLSLLTDWGYRLVMWNSIPPHWIQPVNWTVKQILEQAVPGSVIVLHDGHGHGAKVAQIADTILPGLKRMGYDFVTVEHMERMKVHGR